MEPQQESMLRKLLKHEATWVVSIILAVMGFVNTVILPIQKMQIQLAQIQSDIADNKAGYATVMAIHQTILERLSVLETEVNTLNRSR